MNFLQLCQATREWSGVTATAIGSVSGQVGKQLLIVDAVSDAWNQIQTRHQTWNWLRAEFSAALTAVAPPAEARYTAAALGITRFSNWVFDKVTGSDRHRAMTLYLTSTGLSDEGEIMQIPWELWRRRYGRGSITAGRPTEWAAAPDRKFCLGKPLDAAYTLKGEYWKGVQTMTANTDEPECPSEFHMGIVWLACLRLVEEDEADQLLFSRFENKHTEIMASLERSQLPVITIGGSPLA